MKLTHTQVARTAKVTGSSRKVSTKAKAQAAPATPAAPQEQVETPATPATTEHHTKAEALAAARKVAREAKAQALAERKAATAAKRADGVIGTLKGALETGTTKKEINEVLAAKFPARDPLGMATTVGIQLSRLSAVRPITSVVVEGRGRVYQWADKVAPVPATPAQGE